MTLLVLALLLGWFPAVAWARAAREARRAAHKWRQAAEAWEDRAIYFRSLTTGPRS